MSILSARKKSGLTQYEMADKLGVDQSAISKWETGENMPRAAMLVKIASLCVCGVDELLKPDEAENNYGA